MGLETYERRIKMPYDIYGKYTPMPRYRCVLIPNIIPEEEYLFYKCWEKNEIAIAESQEFMD